jgi:hypothetical protein
MKLIYKHYEWAEKGEMEGAGLCCSMPNEYRYILELFKPTKEEYILLIDNGNSMSFWASGLNYNADFDDIAFKYTPLRQNIVLLICAMEGEL